MAVDTAQTSVTNVATRLDFTSDPMSNYGIVFRNRGTVAVYLGGATVTTGTGFQLDPGESFPASGLDSRRDAVYGIVASGSATVHVFKVGS